MGPKLDDMTLGILGPTDFFGELSLLPVEGGWSHRRSAMVVQNAMLHTLSKTDVQSVSDRFPALRNRLLDHAEDYQRVQAAAQAAKDIQNLSMIKAKKVTPGRAVAISDQDPLAIVKSQLSQQDAKLEQMSGAKLYPLARAFLPLLLRPFGSTCHPAAYWLQMFCASRKHQTAQMQQLMDMFAEARA